MDTGADRDLVARFCEGDREAFAEIYRINHPGIFRFALNMTGAAGRPPNSPRTSSSCSSITPAISILDVVKWRHFLSALPASCYCVSNAMHGDGCR
jgi:hypothetical protein